MSLFHLFSALFFVLNFTGLSKPPAAAVAHVAETVEEYFLFPERLETAEYLPWEEERLLNWEDFQSTPKTNSDAVASTSTALGLTYQLKNGYFKYQVTCNFSKTKSWGLLKTPYILAHEQAHFDITELFARKLHQELQAYELDKKNYREDVSRIYAEVVKEKEAFQKQYDGETDHSRNRKRQLEWLTLIDDLLIESAPYMDYP